MKKLEPAAIVYLRNRIWLANDTMAYLKGYCLLELFAGDEAAGYIGRLNARGKP